MNKLYELKRLEEMVYVYNQLCTFNEGALSVQAVELLLDALVEQVWLNNL
jgi:hypothetical protein